MTILGWAREPREETLVSGFETDDDGHETPAVFPLEPPQRWCAIVSERELAGGGYAYETACARTWLAGPPPIAITIFGATAPKCELCAARAAELERVEREVELGEYSRHDTLQLPPELGGEG